MDLDGLSPLVKVPSKDTVQDVLMQAFLHRNDAVPDTALARVANVLSIEPSEVSKLFSSARVLILAILKSGAVETEAISRLFPENFHSNLKGVLCEIIKEQMPEWRRQLLAQQVSLPRLESFDWRVDVKTSSTCAARMAVPTCLLEMRIDRGSGSAAAMAAPQTVSVEFSTETLHTMLDGLGRIQAQLASVATK